MAVGGMLVPAQGSLVRGLEPSMRRLLLCGLRWGSATQPLAFLTICFIPLWCLDRTVNLLSL